MPHGTVTPGPHARSSGSRRGAVLSPAPARAHARPTRLHSFFELACDRAPEALALVCGEEALSYAALAARANRLAHYLRSLLPGRPVTIGKPLPTYTVHILDEGLRPVPAGELGETCIGGLGVARGYVNRPDLTAARFVPDPFTQGRANARLYRTGDLGRLTPEGEVEFAGRIDSQVKLRGYRIELAEIEAVLLENSAVKDAIVKVVSDGPMQELAGHITLAAPMADLAGLKKALREELRQRVPSYMVPAFLEVIEAIPMLPSGKADRAALPAPTSPRLGGSTACVPPETALERELAEAWGKAFGRTDLSVEDDFFTDLGGHSLFAAQVISDLRRRAPARQVADLRHLGISDLYSHPTIRSLARHIEGLARKAGQATVRKPRREPARHSNARVWLCGLAQLSLSYALAVFLGAPLAHFLSAGYHPLLALPLAGLVTLPAALLLPFAAKWLLIGRFRPGRHRLWGWYYCRWWLVRKLMALSPLAHLAGSPFLAVYARLLGARVGKGCHLGSARLELPDLIGIGDGASIGYAVAVEPFAIEDGWLAMAPIKIGKDAYVGTNSVVMLGSSVGEGASVLEQSLVAHRVPAGDAARGAAGGARPGRHAGGVRAGLGAVDRPAGGGAAGRVPGLGPAHLPGGGGPEVAGGGALPAARRAALVALRLANRADHRPVRERGRPGPAGRVHGHAVHRSAAAAADEGREPAGGQRVARHPGPAGRLRRLPPTPNPLPHRGGEGRCLTPPPPAWGGGRGGGGRLPVVHEAARGINPSRPRAFSSDTSAGKSQSSCPLRLPAGNEAGEPGGTAEFGRGAVRFRANRPIEECGATHRVGPERRPHRPVPHPLLRGTRTLTMLKNASAFASLLLADAPGHEAL
jgi:hypothetical protein